MGSAKGQAAAPHVAGPAKFPGRSDNGPVNGAEILGHVHCPHRSTQQHPEKNCASPWRVHDAQALFTLYGAPDRRRRYAEGPGGAPLAYPAADPQGGGWISPSWSTPMNSCIWFVSLTCALVAIAACGPEAPGTAPVSGTSDLLPKIAVRKTGPLTAGRNRGNRTDLSASR